jgi:hypothetical protein
LLLLAELLLAELLLLRLAGLFLLLAGLLSLLLTLLLLLGMLLLSLGRTSPGLGVECPFCHAGLPPVFCRSRLCALAGRWLPCTRKHEEFVQEKSKRSSPPCVFETSLAQAPDATHT